ncbi:MAG: ribosome-associated translation inhibitor RaiA [Planctomycetes bacterium]|nr:ribosome-associated translation inhibitor RaiA [Planctomycetota bacterium]
MAQIKITARHTTLTDDLKDYALAKAEKLGKYHRRLNKIEIIINQSKNSFTAEMIISVPRSSPIVGQVTDQSCFAALDFLTDKMERQLTKLKGKARTRRHRLRVNKTKMKWRGTAELKKEEFGELEQDDWY